MRKVTVRLTEAQCRAIEHLGEVEYQRGDGRTARMKSLRAAVRIVHDARSQLEMFAKVKTAASRDRAKVRKAWDRVDAALADLERACDGSEVLTTDGGGK